MPRFLTRSVVWLIFAILLVLAYSGHAQTPTAPSPDQQAIIAKLGEEINLELRLRAQVIDLQDQVQKLKDELAKRPPAPPKE